MIKLSVMGWSSVLAAALSLSLARVHPFGNAGFYSRVVVADPIPAQAAIVGDPVRGKDVFEKRCTGCHSLTTDREGPRLQGVVGRPIASIKGFPYSDALRQTQMVWNEETLDRWLTDPDSLIPNSNMDFRVPKPQERKDLIAYLSTMPAER